MTHPIRMVGVVCASCTIMSKMALAVALSGSVRAEKVESTPELAPATVSVAEVTDLR